MSKDNIKVSMVIPAYNYGSYLRKAIDSALAQDYAEPFEVIVVNDSSTDDTDEICRGYGDKIVYLKNVKNVGREEASNRGVAQAKGKYICVLDADDAFLPGAIRWYAKTLDCLPCVGFVYGDFIRVNVDKGTRNRHRSPDFNRELYEVKNIVYCSSQIFRKDYFDKVGGYDKKAAYAADWDLGLKLTEITNGLHVPHFIEERTKKEESMTGKTIREGRYEKCKQYVLRQLKKRKVISTIGRLFGADGKRRLKESFAKEKGKQSNNQCEFIIKETTPRRVLVWEECASGLFDGFREKGLEVVKADKSLIEGNISSLKNFDLIVIWEIFDRFPEDKARDLIQKIMKLGLPWIVLLVATKETYDCSFDVPTHPKSWWTGQFSKHYREVEPEQIHPLLNENNWFYNYGLDNAIFFKKTEK